MSKIIYNTYKSVKIVFEDVVVSTQFMNKTSSFELF